MQSWKALLMVAALGLLMVACGGGGSEATSTPMVGDAASGEQLFSQATIGPAGAPGCITCHSLEPGVVMTGPSQSDVGARAVGRVPGLSAAEYLRQSIIQPNAFVVEDYQPGVMYQTYGEDLTESEIDDLVAYLLTLDGR